MEKIHEVFDADAIGAEFPPIEVKIGGKNYRMEATLSAAKMKKISELEKAAKEKNEYGAIGNKLAEYLDAPADQFTETDIRKIARSIDFIERQLKEQSEGKAGNPTATAPKKLPKSPGHSRASSR